MFYNRRTALFFFIAIIAIIGLGPLESFSIEPYTVRVIYFQPTDSQDRSEWLDLDDIMKSIQITYQDEMNCHGFGNKTFELETNKDGKVIVHKVRGNQNKAAYFSNPASIVIKEFAISRFGLEINF